MLEKLVKYVQSRGIDEELLFKGIQRTYTRYLVDGNFDGVNGLYIMTEIQPSEPVIHGAYASYILNGNLDRIERLHEMTGIKPDITPALAHSGYANYATKRLPEKVTQLYEMTGVKPRPETLKRLCAGTD